MSGKPSSKSNSVAQTPMVYNADTNFGFVSQPKPAAQECKPHLEQEFAILPLISNMLKNIQEGKEDAEIFRSVRQ
jgi:hypothetical protein